MVKTLAQCVDPQVKDVLQRRAFLQAELRGLMTQIKVLVNEDDQDKLVDAIDLVEKLTISKDKLNHVLSELRDLAARLDLDLVEVMMKHDGITNEVHETMVEAQEWILSVKSLKTRMEERMRAQEIFSEGVTRPPSDESGRNFEEIVTTQRDVIKNQESRLEKLLNEVSLLQQKMGDYDSSLIMIDNLKQALSKQQADHEVQKNYYEEAIQTARQQIPSDQGDSAASTPRGPGDRRSTMFGGFGSTGIEQDDLLALSHIMQKSNVDVVRGVLDENRSQQKRFYETMQTPKVELKMFTGDITKYQSFINRYDDIIGNTEMSYSVKLNTLLQYCAPEVQRQLDSCEYQKPQEGYYHARTLLKKRYGRTHLVVNAWLEKMMAYPRVKSPDSMLLFVSDLNCCKQTLLSMGCLGEMDNSDRKRILISKLQPYLQTRWRKKVRELNEVDKTASLDDLIKLVSDAAEENSDPVYGEASLARIVNVYEKTKTPTAVPDVKKKEWKKSLQTHATVGTTGADDESARPKTGVKGIREPCFCCGQGHFTRLCDKFKALPSVGKLKLAREHKMCILCLSPRHDVDACQFTWRCQITPCSGKHNNVFHDALTMEEKNGGAGDAIESLQATKKKSPVMNFANRLNEYALPVCPVFVLSGTSEVPTHAMVDTGGGFTIITKRLQEAAGLQPRKRISFDMSSLVADEEVRDVDVVSFRVRGIDVDADYQVFDAVVLDRELVDECHAKVIKQMRKLAHFSDLNMEVHDKSQIDILVGQDNAHLMHHEREVRGGLPYAPYAVRSPIGWSIHGYNMERGAYPKYLMFNYTKADKTRKVDPQEKAEDENLSLAVERLIKLEEVPEVIQESPENIKIEKLWKKKTRLVDGHIEVPLPIKNDELKLPDNYTGVKKRHDALGRRLLRDDNLRKMFVNAMHENFELGYAEDVDENESPKEGTVWYIPIQPVLNDKKPGKCRIVGDISFWFLGACLNDAIAQGPNYTANIVDILVKFRRYEFVIIGDIKHMYNQVRVPEQERNCLRFLWWKSDDPNQEITKHRMRTQMFGGTWSPAACIHALRWIAEHLQDEYCQETIITILRHFYVDDMLRSIWDEDVGVTVLTETRHLLSRASFHLTKIGSNSKKIMESVPPEDRVKSCELLNLAFEEGFTEHTLGCVWGLIGDVLGFRAVERAILYTRRSVLSVMSSLYDPIGLASPFVLVARCLLQKIVKLGFSWDEQLTEELSLEWDAWVAGLKSLEELKVPRWLGMSNSAQERYQMHTFMDASEKGYGCVTYLCVKTTQGEVLRVTLLAAKAKVAPTKVLTIPRLELSAAVVAVKQDRTLRKYLEVDLDDTVFWSDSTIVLHYVNGRSWQYKTFVANRVAYLQEHSGTQQWRHIDTERNIADVVSRGLTARDLIDKKDWLTGPSFLHHVAEWPPVFNPGQVEVADGEMETKRMSHLKFALVHRVNEESKMTCEHLLTRYSRWNELLRAVCGWHRVMEALRPVRSKLKTGPWTSEEIRQATRSVLRLAQQLYITNEQRTSRMFDKLFPVMDDGLWHVGGRLMNASLTYEERYPVIFPECTVLDAYIFHVHERTGHSGVDRTYYQARMTYWILGGKRSVKRVIGKCVSCTKNRGKFQHQVMAPLPSFRVEEGKVPFEKVGVDYFGPFYVKVGRAVVKRYGCMITDLLMRACHVEIAPDLTSAAFINALQRFISRRGKPAVIVSDNGTNFVGANREMKEALKEWNYQTVGKYMAQEGIKWVFNTPTASHHGGAWERMIRTFRSLALSIVKEHHLTEDSLRTYACVIESVMNSRPLTKITEDPESPLPLTPEHLLNLRRAQGIDGNYEKGDVLRQKWKQVQYLGDKFWKRWVAEYLKSLQLRQKWSKEVPDIKVGDVVLVLWPLGLVIEVVIGRDQHVRSVKLRTETGEFVRPISKVVNLECS